jgi:hypothetical protein
LLGKYFFPVMPLDLPTHGREEPFKLVAWSLNQEWKIDVIDLDAVDGSILDGIESQAEILYEKA